MQWLSVSQEKIVKICSLNQCKISFMSENDSSVTTVDRVLAL